VLHADRAGRFDVVGILVCGECLQRYSVERRRPQSQGLRERPFMQSLLSAAYRPDEA
jgi:hypothetical protein